MIELPFEKVRLWQTHFAVHRAFPSLPVPEMVVEEIQQHPSYRMNGAYRYEDGAQIVITVSGKGGLTAAGKDYSLTPGKAFLHNHNDPDVCYFYPQGEKDVWNFLWIAFCGGNSAELVSDINRNYGYLFDIPLDSGLVRKLRDYKKFSGEMLILSPSEGAALVYSSLEQLCNPAITEYDISSHSAMIGEIQKMIAAEPGAELQVGKIASEYQISREHLSRIFLEETGVTLHEYIIRFRLKMAIDLLLQTRLSKKEIASRCGWNDYSNFYRLFRKRFNHSPDEIRSSGIRPL
ncbi:MAG: helix-turn-helix transcriptional regulator [Lentisphaeria bacterium]|nr:helix-turn-helix transcriptional regulator [Lentisphaeria bacterium]